MSERFRPRLRHGRSAFIVALVLLAGLMSIGLGSAPTAAQVVPYPRPSPTSAAPTQDALWYFANQDQANTGVCVNPTSSTSLASCFPTLPFNQGSSHPTRATTDGTYMYFVTIAGQSQKCPILALAINCQSIFAGPFNGAPQVTSVAAFGDSLYIGDANTNGIYQCPNDMTYASSYALPAECVTYNFPGDTVQADSMVVVNDRLFVGMEGDSSSGVIYSCNLDLSLGCSDPWDSFGKNNHAWSMTAGGGFLWVGLDNGILWRCSVDTPNDCQNWDTAGTPIVSVVYDGGWIYAGVSNKYDSHIQTDRADGVLWKCPASTPNACQTILTPGPFSGGIPGSTMSTQTVTAGAGNVFANIRPAISSDPATYWGTRPFTLTVLTTDGSVCGETLAVTPLCAPWPMGLFYVPIGGVITPGALRLSLDRPSRVVEQCAKVGEVIGTVKISGPNSKFLLRDVDLCTDSDLHFGALDPGEYVVSVAVGGDEVLDAVVIERGTTTSWVLGRLLQPRFTG